LKVPPLNLPGPQEAAARATQTNGDSRNKKARNKGGAAKATKKTHTQKENA
jgi:hypothetical protein